MEQEKSNKGVIGILILIIVLLLLVFGYILFGKKLLNKTNDTITTKNNTDNNISTTTNNNTDNNISTIEKLLINNNKIEIQTINYILDINKNINNLKNIVYNINTKEEIYLEDNSIQYQIENDYLYKVLNNKKEKVTYFNSTKIKKILADGKDGEYILFVLTENGDIYYSNSQDLNNFEKLKDANRVEDMTLIEYAGIYTGECSSVGMLVYKIDNNNYINIDNKSILFNTYINELQAGEIPVCMMDNHVAVDMNKNPFNPINKQYIVSQASLEKIAVDYLLMDTENTYFLTKDYLYVVSSDKVNAKKIADISNIEFNRNSLNVVLKNNKIISFLIDKDYMQS